VAVHGGFAICRLKLDHSAIEKSLRVYKAILSL